MHKHHTKSPLHIIPFGLKQGVWWTRALLEASILSRLDILPECNRAHRQDSEAGGQTHTWVTGLFTPKPFPHWLPKCGEPGNAPTSGCGKLLSLRHPLETSTGEGRRLCDKNQEVTSSSLCRTLKGGAGERSKCGWEVSEASEDPVSQRSLFQYLLIFPLLWGEADLPRLPSPSRHERKKSGYPRIPNLHLA